MSTQYVLLGSPVAQMFHAMAACRTAHHLRRKSGFGMNCQSVKVATYWCGCRLHLQTCTSLILNACTYVHLSFPFRVCFMWPLTNKFRKCKVERGSDGGGKPEWSPTICVDTGTAAVIDGHLSSLSQYCSGNHRRDKRGQGSLCVCVCLSPKLSPWVRSIEVLLLAETAALPPLLDMITINTISASNTDTRLSTCCPDLRKYKAALVADERKLSSVRGEKLTNTRPCFSRPN